MLHVLGRERVHSESQFVEATDPSRHELGVDGVVREDLANDAGEQCWIFARLHLQEQIGIVGHLGATRIDHDELQTVCLCSSQPNERIEARQTTGIAVGTDQCVAPDDHRDCAGLERLHTGQPCAVSHRSDELRRLIDGDRRVETWRTNGLVKCARDRKACCVLKCRSAAVRGKRSRTMAFDESGELVGDFVERERSGNRLKTVALPLHAAVESRVVVMLVTEMATLDTRVALVHGIVEDAANGNNPICCDVDINIDGTSGMTETAERAAGLDCFFGLHGGAPRSDDRDGNRITA